MRVYIDQMEHSLDGISLMEFNEFWLKETKRLFSSKRFFYSVEINGIPYMGGYEEAIVNNFTSIKEIKITTIAENELIESSLEELFAYNKKIIQACESIGAIFYGEVNEGDWKSFSMLIEGVQWVYNHSNSIQEVLTNNNQKEELRYFLREHVKNLEQLLKQIERALDEKEYTQLADIISYELSDLCIQLDALLAASER